jgi:hypothetical protein
VEARQSGEDRHLKEVERFRKQKKRRLRKTRSREKEEGRGKREANYKGGSDE